MNYGEKMDVLSVVLSDKLARKLAKKLNSIEVRELQQEIIKIKDKSRSLGMTIKDNQRKYTSRN